MEEFNTKNIDPEGEHFDTLHNQAEELLGDFFEENPAVHWVVVGGFSQHIYGNGAIDDEIDFDRLDVLEEVVNEPVHIVINPDYLDKEGLR